MNKLTADKCREMFLNLFEDKRQDGITLKEELYLQALEVALPILEQQERGDGWIEWGGGLDPADKYVEVKFRTGSTDRDYVRRFTWQHEGDQYDIIAYRITPENSDEN